MTVHSSSAPPLAHLQRWMQAVVLHPEGVLAGAASAAARRQIDVDPAELERLVTRSHALGAAERLAIYQRGIRQRFLETLGEMLPALRHALGEALFAAFAGDYLAARPSRSYTLFELDASFADFLAATRPDRDLPPEQRETWPDFMIELAAFERAFRKVFDGPGIEGKVTLSPERLAALADAELDRARLTVSPALRLFDLRFPVHRFMQEVRRGDAPEIPAPRRSRVALHRRDFTVEIHPLERRPHAVLQALVRGADVATARVRASAGLEDVRPWLLEGAANAFFLSEIQPNDQNKSLEGD